MSPRLFTVSRRGLLVLKVPLLGLLLLTSAGCFLVPSPFAQKLNPVGDEYSSIRHGITRKGLEAKFGRSSREEDGASVWETRFDELNYATLKVWFGSQDTAEKIEVTRAHGASSPGHSASASSVVSR
jgi:hypothetical protein